MLELEVCERLAGARGVWEALLELEVSEKPCRS